MKQFTDKEKGYVFRYLEPRADAIMDMVRQNPNERFDNEIRELEVIKSILEKMIDNETITGVITQPKSQLEDAIEFATKMSEQLNNK